MEVPFPCEALHFVVVIVVYNFISFSIKVYTRVVYVCAPFVCMSPQRSEEGVSSPGTGVLGVSEPGTLSAFPSPARLCFVLSKTTAQVWEVASFAVLTHAHRFSGFKFMSNPQSSQNTDLKLLILVASEHNFCHSPKSGICT